LNYHAVVYDSVAQPKGSDSYKALPTILWSGELHGDERVGPTAVLETTLLLLHATKCESYITTSNESQVCRTILQSQYGITSAQRMWLACLVTT
jgi:hypothetical protein